MTRQKSEGGLGPLRGRVAALPAGPETTRQKATAQGVAPPEAPPVRDAVAAGGVPHQARIERLGGEDGDEHHGAEGERADAGLDGDGAAELHQRAQSDSMKMSTIDQRPIQATM